MKFKSFFLAVLALAAFTSTVQAAFSGANGLLSVSIPGSNGISVNNPDGTGQRVLVADAIGYSAWSADGRKISYLKGGDIWLANSDGSGAKNLTNSPDTEKYSAWSPDGNKIAFTRYMTGGEDIFVMNADGTNQQRLTNNSFEDTYIEWSPKGDKIAFGTNRDGNFEIYVINPDGSNPINLTKNYGGDGFPSWSPDGTKITFTSDLSGNAEIYVMNADGSDLINLTNNPAYDEQSAWSPDGSHIAFASNRSGTRSIYTMRIDGSQQTRLTSKEYLLPNWQPIPTTNKTINVTDTGFTLQNIRVAMGQQVGWNISGNLVHDIFDNSNIGLFGSGKVSNGGSYGATFFAAGSYPFIDHSNLATGAIHVPLRVSPQTGLLGTTFSVTWSSLVPKSTFSFDVQVKKPGATAWINFTSNTTTRLAKITPAIAGTYTVRARLRGHGHIGRWSAPKAFTVQ